MAVAQTLVVEKMETPIGDLLVVTDHEGALRAAHWLDYKYLVQTLLRRRYPQLAITIEPRPDRSTASRALEDYFKGNVKAVEGLPVAMGGTDFQRRVWNALRDIPAGETVSYSLLAARIGRPTAVRAVGHANGANIIDIVVPCHRVIGANGSLTGFGGGLDRKRWLLDHECKWVAGSV